MLGPGRFGFKCLTDYKFTGGSLRKLAVCVVFCCCCKTHLKLKCNTEVLFGWCNPLAPVRECHNCATRHICTNSRVGEDRARICTSLSDRFTDLCQEDQSRKASIGGWKGQTEGELGECRGRADLWVG